MNWSHWKNIPWIDSRAAFVARLPKGGSLLDLGTSDGKTLCHMAELRPDLFFHAVDLEGPPPNKPDKLEFRRVDLERDRVPWNAATFDGITCMHLIEHLHATDNLWNEIARVLKPGGICYIETPHPKSITANSAPGRMAGRITLNFYDDSTHTRPVPIGVMAQAARLAGLEVIATGTARNWLFAAAYPLFLLVPAGRKRFIAWLHWTGWSAYLIAGKPKVL